MGFKSFPKADVEAFSREADPEGARREKPSVTRTSQKEEKRRVTFHISTYLDADTYAAFKNQMEREGHTPASLARKIIKEHFGVGN